MSLRRKLAWIGVLYFAQGYPFGVASKAWPVYFRVHGVSVAEIGLMSLLFLPYTLKPIWAPLVDRFGSRQRWIVAALLALAAVTVGFAALDPGGAAPLLWLTLLAFTLASATQDIAIDAYAVDVASERDRGPINGVRVALYRVAMVAGGGLWLVVADWLGWRAAWTASAGLLVVLAAMAAASPRAPSVATWRLDRSASDSRRAAASPRFPRVATSAPMSQRAQQAAAGPTVSPHAQQAAAGVTPEAAGLARQASRTASPASPHWVRAGRWPLLAAAAVLLAVAAWSGWQPLWLALAALPATAVVASFLDPALLGWLGRREMLPVLGIAFLYKLPDSALLRMVEPFWVDRGLSPSEIGLVSTGLGSGLVIAGALAGGWFVQQRGLFSGLVWFGLGQCLSNAVYASVALLDLPRESIYGAAVVESFTFGLGTAAFLSFLMAQCDREHAATQFALLTALLALSRDVLGAFSGVGAEALGYGGYFALTALLAAPGLALLPLVRERTAEGAAAR